MRRRLVRVVVVLGVCLGVVAPPALADGPGVGAPWVAGLGDSYISGEAGRWAGNSNASESRVDALGSSAYWDTATGEAIPRCHRSKSAEMLIGGGVNGVNLACSGATTQTSDGDRFKPGLDFYDAGGAKTGQALALQRFAATRNVRMVTVSIGGNDFKFADVVTQCVADFLASPSWWPDYCYDDSKVKANFTAANVAAVTAKVRAALLNVRTAMRNAGYADSQWTLVVQDYESPVPRGAGFRYGQSGYGRQSTGGCGFWNRDADWANDTALPTINGAVRNAATGSGITNLRLLSLSSAFDGRRLCETGVDLVEHTVGSWTAPGAVDRSEWVNQIRTVSTIGGNYYLQESLHPNYWGQLALRSCVRQAYNGGAPRGGTCVRSGTGLTSAGEPVMALR